jgi:hypothetical protein
MKMTTMLVGHHFAADHLEVVTKCEVDVWELLLQRATVCQRAVELEASACPQRHAEKHTSIALNCGHSSGAAGHDPLTRMVDAQSDHHPVCLQRCLQVAARALECCRHQVVGEMPCSYPHDKDVGGAVATSSHQRHQCGTHLVNHPNLLDGSKWLLAHEIHAWATLQWVDDASLGAMALVDCLLQTNIVAYGGQPAVGSVGDFAAMVSQVLRLKSPNAVLEWGANGVAAKARAALHAVVDPHSLRTFAAMRLSASRCLENQPVCDCRSVVGDVPQFPNRTWRVLDSVEPNEAISSARLNLLLTAGRCVPVCSNSYVGKRVQLQRRSQGRLIGCW